MKRMKAVEREVLRLGRNPEFRRIIAEARARFAAGRKLSLEEFERLVLPKRSSRKTPKTPRRTVAKRGAS